MRDIGRLASIYLPTRTLFLCAVLPRSGQNECISASWGFYSTSELAASARLSQAWPPGEVLGWTTALWFRGAPFAATSVRNMLAQRTRTRHAQGVIRKAVARCFFSQDGGNCAAAGWHTAPDSLDAIAAIW